MLSDGAKPTKSVEAAAKAAGISERTLRRAREDLRVEARKEGLGGGWALRLPSVAAHEVLEGGQAPLEDLLAPFEGGQVASFKGGQDDPLGRLDALGQRGPATDVQVGRGERATAEATQCDCGEEDPYRGWHVQGCESCGEHCTCVTCLERRGEGAA